MGPEVISMQDDSAGSNKYVMRKRHDNVIV